MKNNKEVAALVVLAVLLTAGGLVYMAAPQSFEHMSGDDATTRSTISDTQNSSSTKSLVPLDKKQSNAYIARDGAYVIKYTNNGFVPRQIQIPRGKTIRFINMSDRVMRVFSDDTLDPKFVELNESQSVGEGGTYTFSFTTQGLWAYHNQLYPDHTANVFVY